ncbi:MAG: hypothetical protein WDA22_12665 [Bacteroidota bacterium]
MKKARRMSFGSEHCDHEPIYCGGKIDIVHNEEVMQTLTDDDAEEYTLIYDAGCVSRATM